MKNVFLCAMLLSGVLLASCTDGIFKDEEECDYSDCITEEPTEGKLVVKISSNDAYPSVPITIYKGFYDTGTEFMRDTLYASGKTYLLPLDQYYTIAAYYETPTGTIIAIDGDKLKKKQYYECDSVCWKKNDVYINVQLNE